MQLATPLLRRDRTGALLSVALVEGRVISRLATDQPTSDHRSWLSLIGATGALPSTGGGSTSYDGGNLWLHSATFRRLEDGPVESLDHVHAVIDGRPHALAPVNLAVLRSASMSVPRFAAQSGACRGCGASTTNEATFCTACKAAIRSASEAGRCVSQHPDHIIALGTAVGEVDGGEVTLIDIEVYGGISLLRSWWAVSAEDDEPLHTLHPPLDQRMELQTDTGQRYIIAPGGTWTTDGRGVEAHHRIIGEIQPGARSLRISFPRQPQNTLSLDLPDRTDT